MKPWRGFFALVGALTLALVTKGIVAQDRKMSDQQKKEIQNIVKVVDSVAAGCGSKAARAGRHGKGR